MKLTILPSSKGDCMLLESPDGTAILIDGGMKDSYITHVRPFLGKWRSDNSGRDLDLVYLSHIDQDHIAGILQLMDDIVAWRVYHHKTNSGDAWPKPGFPEPPGAKELWHNGFHAIAGDNAGEIGSRMAARAAQLSTSVDPRVVNMSNAYRAIANSIPEAIKLSSRVSPEQLDIPLNKKFQGMLALVRDPPEIADSDCFGRPFQSEFDRGRASFWRANDCLWFPPWSTGRFGALEPA